MGVAPKSAEKIVLIGLVLSEALYGSSCIVVVSLALAISHLDRVVVYVATDVCHVWCVCRGAHHYGRVGWVRRMSLAMRCQCISWVEMAILSRAVVEVRAE